MILMNVLSKNIPHETAKDVLLVYALIVIAHLFTLRFALKIDSVDDFNCRTDASNCLDSPC